MLILENGDRIPNRLTGNIVAAGASYAKNFKGFDFKANAEANVSGDFDGYNLHAETSYEWDSYAKFYASLYVNSRAANYNHLLYQSTYRNYNWYNEPSYSNVKTNTLSAGVKSKKWMDVEASFTTIQDYAFSLKQEQIPL